MVIRWSTFAESWNKWVDTLGHSKPTVTYKSASHLQDAYKSMKRRAVRQATLRPHTQTIRELRSSHTNREAAVAYLPEFAQPEPPTVAQPFVDATDTVDQDQAPNYDGDSDEPERAAAHQPRRRKNSGKRCRKCGKEYAHKDWKEFHVVTQAPTSGNLRSNDIKIDEHCTVPIDQYEPGFPFLDLTKRMPKRKRGEGNPGFVVRRVRAYPNFPPKKLSVGPSVCLSVRPSVQKVMFVFFRSYLPNVWITDEA